MPRTPHPINTVIVELLKRGCGVAQIARALGVSTGRVAKVKRNLIQQGYRLPTGLRGVWCPPEIIEEVLQAYRELVSSSASGAASRRGST